MTKEKCGELLTDLVGVDGVETLSKAIFRASTASVADPLELYLPLLVVPRAILSWLAENLTAMEVGEDKDFHFPSRPDTTIHVVKDLPDVYRGKFIREGKVIHTFDKSTIPSLGGHMMSVMESYDFLQDKDSPRKPLDGNGTELSSKLIDLKIKELEHDNYQKLIGTIGTLVDALVSKHKDRVDFKEALEDMGKEEVKTDHKVEDAMTPEEKQKADEKAKKKEKNSEEGWTLEEVDQYKQQPQKDLDTPKIKDQNDKDRDEAKIKLCKEQMPESKPNYFRAKLTKAGMKEGMSGAAMPKQPKMPQQPKPPVPAGHNPAGQAAKQSQRAASGKPPAMPKPPKMPSAPMGKSEYFKQKLQKSYKVTEDQLYSACEHCGTAQFTKTSSGPTYSPCACFMVTKNSNFVSLTKNENSYSLTFNQNANQESIKAFLLALKSRLLMAKAGIWE
jgi:hypothetical protein